MNTDTELLLLSHLYRDNRSKITAILTAVQLISRNVFLIYQRVKARRENGEDHGYKFDMKLGCIYTITSVNVTKTIVSMLNSYSHIL